MITVSVPLNDTNERLELSHSKLLSDLVGDNYNSMMNDNDTSSIMSDLTNDREEEDRSTTINALQHNMNNIMDDTKSCAKSHARSCDSVASSFADLLNMMHTMNKDNKDSINNMFDTPISVKSRVSFAKSDTCIGQPPSTRRGLLQRRSVYTCKNSSDSRGHKSLSAVTTSTTTNTQRSKSRKISSADSVGQRISVPIKKGSTSHYTPSNTFVPKTPRSDTRRSKKQYTSRRRRSVSADGAEMSRYKLAQEGNERVEKILR